MSNNFNYQNDPRHGSGHGSPPNPQDLMGSLISPGPATPNQGTFNPQWPLVQGWDAIGQGPFGEGTPFQGQMQFSQPNFGHMGLQDFVPFENNGDKEMDMEPYSPTLNSRPQNQLDDLSDRYAPQQQDVGQGPPAQILASVLAPSQQKPEPPPATKAAQPTAKPIDTQNLAAELRAKLLASRPQSAGSAQSNVSGKNKELPILQKSKMQETTKDTPTESGPASSGVFGKNPLLQKFAPSNETGTATLKPQSQGSDKSGMSAEIDSLFAEARNAADWDTKQGAGIQAGKPTPTPAKSTAINTQYVRPTTVETERPPLNPDVSSDEEGEIRGDSTQPTSIDQQDAPPKPVESRQETMTEAPEKEDRLSETRTVYGNWQKGNTKPAKLSSANASKAMTSKKVSEISPTTQQSRSKPSPPKATKDAPYVGWSGGRPVYDSYQPSRDKRREPEPDARRRESDQERRVSSNSAQAKDPGRVSKEALEAKSRALTDSTARAAEIYKRAADAKQQQHAMREPEGQRRDDRVPQGQPDSRRFSEPSNTKRDVNMADAAEPRLAPASRRDSGQYQFDAQLISINDQDIADWLEMTQYFDESYRLRKLSRFRKLRELEAQRAELEREEQMELEERSNLARTHSAVSPPSNSFSPKVLPRGPLANPKMPPPSLPLPLREMNNEAPLPQATTSTLKRQYTEVDTDARPAEKFARADHDGTRTRGSSPTNSVKGVPLSARFAPPLEDRISRYDDPDHRYSPRRRSPSPNYAFHPDSRDRRRSWSPRHNSNPRAIPPERPFHNSCFKCGQQDHQHRECPHPRRDGQDGKGAFLKDGPGGFAVSSNYKGKNPKPFRPPPSGVSPYERGRATGKDGYGSRVGSLNRGDDV